MYTKRKSRRRKEGIDMKEVTSADTFKLRLSTIIPSATQILKPTAFITQCYANLLRSFNNYTKDIKAFRINSLEKLIYASHLKSILLPKFN